MNVIPKAILHLQLLFSLTACSSTTVLLANFNADPIGAQPTQSQPVGFVTAADGAGTIRVVASPIATSAGNKWVRIRHSTQTGPETRLRARFDSNHGPGRYNLAVALFIPTGTGAVTVQLESFDNSVAPLLLLDFMPENDVRINDNDGNRFGAFPRAVSFVLSINVDTVARQPTATVTLIGGAASGSKEIILPSTAQFGAVKFWVGFGRSATVFLDDLLVVRQND